MKNAIKKAISVLLIAVMLFGAAPLAGFVGIELPEFNLFSTKAEAVKSGTCGDNLTWTFDESTGELVISGTGDMWEEPNWPSGIRTVKISEGVTGIGKRAFSGSSLECVTISDSVINIGEGAFYNSRKLRNVTIGSGVTSIADNAFVLCFGLKNITVDFSNTAYSSDENGVLFNKDKTVLVCYPKGDPRTSYEIPESVTIIGPVAFEDCRNLTNVTIPASVTSIGDSAFIQCYNLESVIIPDSVTTIENAAFLACPGMEYIHIPSSVTTLGNNIILSDADKADGIESIKNDLETATDEELAEYAQMGMTKEVVANWKPTTLICSDSENSAAKTFAAENGNQFEVCNGHDSGDTPDVPDNPENPDLITGVCGDNLTWTFDESTGKLVISGTGDMWDWNGSDMPWYAYRTSIKTITLPDSLTNIGDYAFAFCENLASIEIPDSVTSIGEAAFRYCLNLASITLPDSVTNIGRCAFLDCTSLASIEIPYGVINIDEGAFACCINLTSIILPDSITSIGDYAFVYCTALLNIEIPDSVTSIGDGVFADCSNLKDAVIGDGLTSISFRMFKECEKLTNVTIGESVTSIGSEAFDTCYKFSNVTIPDGVTSIGERAFYGCVNLSSVTIPDSVTSIGDNAFNTCLEMDYIHIPSSVTTIGSYIIMPDDEQSEYVEFFKTFLENATEEVLAEYAQMGVTKETVANWSPTTLICSDSEDGAAKTFAEQNGNEFRVCSGHDTPDTPDIPDNPDLITGTCGDNLTWTFNESTGELVISGTGDMWDFLYVLQNVPWYPYFSSIKTVTIADGVTSISGIAFIGSSVTSVIIPQSVKSIGLAAFSGCTSLTDLSLSEGLEKINYNAFEGCTSLTSITIPNSITYIDSTAFRGCTSLADITICDGATGIAHIAFDDTAAYNDSTNWDGDVFYIGNRLMKANETLSGNYRIKEGTKIIGESALGFCRALESIEIPDSVIRIETLAFWQCVNLSSITIPEGVTSIGEVAFLECMALDEIHIPSSVTSIGINVVLSDTDKANIIEEFSNMSDEEFAEYAEMGITKDKVANWKPTTLICSDSENSAAKTFAEENGNQFAVCNGHDVGEDPELISGICGDNLTWTLNPVTGELVISGTGDMYDWKYDYDVPWYNYRTEIKTVTLPEELTSIGETAFGSCIRLTDLTIPNSVTSIGDVAFLYCWSMRYIHIPSNVTSIGFGIVATDSAKANFIDWVENMTDEEFAEEVGTSGLTREEVASWPKTTLICSDSEDAYAKTYAEQNGNEFAVCNGHDGGNPDVPDTPENPDLITGVCGDNLTWTFDESTSKLTISGTGEIPFALYQSMPWDIYSSIKTVEISDGVTGIGYRAFMSCSGLTNIIIPDSVTSIGQEAFYYCSELVNITIDPDNDSYSSDEYGVLFNRDKTALVYYPEGHRRTNYTIPDGVVSIGYRSFLNNSYLMSLEIPDTVVHIEQGAFSESAIYENPDNWEDSVLYIDDCLIKAEESIPGDYTVRGGTRYIGEGAFVGCFNLKNVILPDSLKVIDGSAFAICYSLEDIILPDGVTNVGEYAFVNCVSMEYIHIPSSVKSIGEAAVPSDSDKVSFLEYLKNISDDELAEIGLTKEKVEKLKPTTLICSDSEDSAAKTFAEQNGNQFRVCGGDHREEFTATFIVDGVQTVITLKEGDAITMEDPVKEGHTFVGWTPEVPETMTAENLEFTAVFEVNSYTVTWYVNGMVMRETRKYGDVIEKTITMDKEGHTFVGWTPEVPETMPAYDLEFTAIFEINIFDAVFNANGGIFPDGDSVKRISTEYNAEIIAPQEPERAGYLFAGWAYNGKNIGTDVGVMDGNEDKIFDAVWVYNDKATYRVETYTMNTYGEYEVSFMLVNAFVGEEVSVNPTAAEGFEINEEMSVLNGTVSAEEPLVLKVYMDRQQYKFTVVVLDKETTKMYYYGAVVARPGNPYVDGYSFQYWEPSVPTIMPAHDVTITAILKEYKRATIQIITPEKRTLKYGESITLQARVQNMPSYATIKWVVIGDGVSIKPSASGKTCKVTSTSNGNVVIRAYVVDSKGNTIMGEDLRPVYDFEYLYSDVNWWQIIVNFIRQLFGKTDTVSQMFKVLY